MAFSRDFSDVRISSFDTILNRWSHVSMPCIFVGCLIKPSSARFSRSMAAHNEEFALQGEKYQTCLILSSRPREVNFSPQFPRTCEETAEQTASRGSLLSSFLKCAAGFNCNPFVTVLLFSCLQFGLKFPDRIQYSFQSFNIS